MFSAPPGQHETAPGESGLRVAGPSDTAGKSEGMRDDIAPGDGRRRSASARGVKAAFPVPPAAAAGAAVSWLPSLPVPFCSIGNVRGERTRGESAHDGRRDRTACPCESRLGPFTCIEGFSLQFHSESTKHMAIE